MKVFAFFVAVALTIFAGWASIQNGANPAVVYGAGLACIVVAAELFLDLFTKHLP